MPQPVVEQVGEPPPRLNLRARSRSGEIVPPARRPRRPPFRFNRHILVSCRAARVYNRPRTSRGFFQRLDVRPREAVVDRQTGDLDPRRQRMQTLLQLERLLEPLHGPRQKAGRIVNDVVDQRHYGEEEDERILPAQSAQRRPVAGAGQQSSPIKLRQREVRRIWRQRLRDIDRLLVTCVIPATEERGHR